MTTPTEHADLGSAVERLPVRLRATGRDPAPVDPKANYRTRPVALFDEAADALEAQAALIEDMAGALAEAEALLSSLLFGTASIEWGSASVIITRARVALRVAHSGGRIAAIARKTTSEQDQ